MISAALFQLMVTIGIFYAMLLGTKLQWDYLTIPCSVVPLVYMTLISFCPDSPKFLISKNKIEEAKGALKRLRGLYFEFFND